MRCKSVSMVVVGACLFVLSDVPVCLGQGAPALGPLTPESNVSAQKQQVSCGPYYPLVSRYLKAGVEHSLALLEYSTQLRSDAVLAELARYGGKPSTPTARRNPDADFFKARAAYEGNPFFIAIAGPCGRVTEIAQRAQKRYEEAVFPPMDDLNQEGVVVRVRPARIAQTQEQRTLEGEAEKAATYESPLESPAQELARLAREAANRPDPFVLASAVENVVLKRGDQVFRPTKKRITPIAITSSAGVSKVVSEGEFSFPFDAFLPLTNITLVIIGPETTTEFLIAPTELGSVK